MRLQFIASEFCVVRIVFRFVEGFFLCRTDLFLLFVGWGRLSSYISSSSSTANSSISESVSVRSSSAMSPTPSPAVGIGRTPVKVFSPAIG